MRACNVREGGAVGATIACKGSMTGSATIDAGARLFVASPAIWRRAGRNWIYPTAVGMTDQAVGKGSYRNQTVDRTGIGKGVGRYIAMTEGAVEAAGCSCGIMCEDRDAQVSSMRMAEGADGGVCRVRVGVGNISTSSIKPGGIRMGGVHVAIKAGCFGIGNTAFKIRAVTALAHGKTLVDSGVGETRPCLGGGAVELKNYCWIIPVGIAVIGRSKRKDRNGVTFRAACLGNASQQVCAVALLARICRTFGQDSGPVLVQPVRGMAGYTKSRGIAVGVAAPP